MTPTRTNTLSKKRSLLDAVFFFYYKTRLEMQRSIAKLTAGSLAFIHLPNGKLNISKNVLRSFEGPADPQNKQNNDNNIDRTTHVFGLKR